MENIGEELSPIGENVPIGEEEHIDEPLPSVIEKQKNHVKMRNTQSGSIGNTEKRQRKLAELEIYMKIFNFVDFYYYS